MNITPEPAITMVCYWVSAGIGIGPIIGWPPLGSIDADGCLALRRHAMWCLSLRRHGQIVSWEKFYADANFIRFDDYHGTKIPTKYLMKQLSALVCGELHSTVDWRCTGVVVTSIPLFVVSYIAPLTGCTGVVVTSIPLFVVSYIAPLTGAVQVWLSHQYLCLWWAT